MTRLSTTKREQEAPPERCENCRFALGPASMPVLQCTSKTSEFFAGPVAIDGWCLSFEPPESA